MIPSWASLSVQTGLKQRIEYSKSFRPQNSTQDRTLRDTLTEPLKERKILRSTSSEKGGCRATRLMKRFRALRRPSMNSLSAGGEYRVTMESAEPCSESASEAKNRGQQSPTSKAPSTHRCGNGQDCPFQWRTLGGWVSHTSVFLALGRLRQEEYSKMEHSLSYSV